MRVIDWRNILHTLRFPQTVCVSAELIVVFRNTEQFNKKARAHDRTITDCKDVKFDLVKKTLSKKKGRTMFSE